MITVLENGHVVVSEETAQALKAFGYNKQEDDACYTVVTKMAAITAFDPEIYAGNVVNMYYAPDIMDAKCWLENKFGITFNLKKSESDNTYWWEVIDNRTGEFIGDYSMITDDNEYEPLSDTMDMICEIYLDQLGYSDNAAIYCPNNMPEIINKLRSLGYVMLETPDIKGEETIYIDLHGHYMITVNGVATNALYDESDMEYFLQFAAQLIKQRTYVKHPQK